MTSVPSTQWASAALESLPAWKTPTSSASTPAKSRMGEQVHRYTQGARFYWKKIKESEKGWIGAGGVGDGFNVDVNTDVNAAKRTLK